jgi:hypothetical protein
MHAAPPRGTLQIFNRTAPLAMNAALERYIGAYLMHEDVFLKSTAAKTLARYGSPAALPGLWAAFRYFHDYWKGKGPELEKLGQGVGLEVDLRDAIARGRGWLANETDLRLIESLCTSGRCIQETRQDLEAWKPPMRIDVYPQASGINGKVGQYYALDTVAALEAKLAQFPRGAHFVLYGPPGKLSADIIRFGAEKGLTIAAWPSK